MNIYISLLVALLISMLLVGCTTNPDTGEQEVTPEGQIILRSAVRAATIRLIDTSPLVDADRVVEVVAEIRDRINLDGEVTADELLATALTVIDVDVLTAYERMLIEDILLLAESRLESERIGRISARAGELLDWIESAARLAR